MRWPADHPACGDEALLPHLAGADELCPDAQVRSVLRVVPGRRIATLVTTDGGLAVLKVFARPRARGNHRRLRALGASSAAAIVPRELGVDRRGHVSLVAFTPGTVLDQLPDDAFAAAADAVGAALAALHRSGAELDRCWTVQDELAQLDRRATGRLRALTGGVALDGDALACAASETLVPAHRDFHPRQVVVADDGDIALIDLDDAAAAPAGLDVGNFLAHLTREAVVHGRPDAAVEAAREGFLRGYRAAGGVSWSEPGTWERLALLRLIGLAESRHQRTDWADALVARLHTGRAA